MRIRTVVSVLAAVVLLAGLGLVVFWRAIDRNLPLPIAPSSCVATAGSATSGAAGPSAAVTTASDGKVTLNPGRMANAATIAAVGMRRGVPPRAIVVALATASQESKLDNLTGGDRDSIGLFQQRPSQGWGTPEQISDPRYAANAFYIALLKVPGWQQLRVTEAAQAVQHSAHPEAYERWADHAEILARAFAGDSTGAVRCTIPGTPELQGAPATSSIAEGLRQDWGEIATAAVDLPGLAVQVADTRTGWRYAHWLVANSAQRGVKRVRFDNLQWTARTGTWRKADAAAARGQVVAEVYPG